MTNRKVRLEFAETDLPLLAAALRTAACAALATGNHQALKRLDEYRAVIDTMIPAAARIFEGACWSEICMALGDSKTYGVGFEKWGWNEKDGKYGVIRVVVGDKCWQTSDYRNFPSKGGIDAVKSLLEELAPLDATRIEIEETLARHLRPIPVQPAKAQRDDFQDDDELNHRGFNP